MKHILLKLDSNMDFNDREHVDDLYGLAGLDTSSLDWAGDVQNFVCGPNRDTVA